MRGPLSSLIHRFRAFVGDMTEVLHGPVVIGIDELDKMNDPERVAALLRDIKGIFEIDGAFFLVSISDEAARSLGLGALRTRNEFNSSFYTVLQLEPLDPSDCRQLLEMRTKDFSSEIASLIGIMSGGVAREVVRIAELVHSSSIEFRTANSGRRRRTIRPSYTISFRRTYSRITMSFMASRVGR